MDYNYLKSGAFWSVVLLVIYNSLVSIVPLFPNIIWLTVAINVIGVILTTAFHTAAVKRAARASAHFGRAVYK